jgi:hypothetical protein
MTLGPFGQDYTRNITWAEQAKAWNMYLARCSFLLQQGKPVSDVAYFYGEDAPATVPYWKKDDPALPPHYGFDFLNADVLLHGATATSGQLHLASGTTYRVLVLPADQRLISLPLLRSIHSLVEQGAVLLGPKPVGSPSLGDGPGAQSEISKLASDLWGEGEAAAQGHVFGKGKVYSGKSIEDVLAAEEAGQDFSWTAPENVGKDIPYSLPGADSDEDLLFIHRRDGDGDIFFVSTQKHHGFDVRAAFRVSGKTPLLWHPESGEVEPVSYSTEQGRTVVPLHFDAQGSVFVVFEGSGAAPSRAFTAPQHTKVASIDGPWKRPWCASRSRIPCSRVMDRKQRCRREVFLGLGHLSQAGGRPQGLVQAGTQGDARSRHSQGLRRSRNQWQARWRSPMEASVRHRRLAGSETRQQRNQREGNESLA